MENIPPPPVDNACRFRNKNYETGSRHIDGRCTKCNETLWPPMIHFPFCSSKIVRDITRKGKGGGGGRWGDLLPQGNSDLQI